MNSDAKPSSMFERIAPVSMCDGRASAVGSVASVATGRRVTTNTAAAAAATKPTDTSASRQRRCGRRAGGGNDAGMRSASGRVSVSSARKTASSIFF